MSSVLLILFGGESPDASMNWVRVNRNSGEIVQRGELAVDATAPTAAPADTMLILPGSEAQVKSLELSTGSEAQARAAAAYLFEGALAVEKVNAVFALGAEVQGRRLVAAVDRRRLQRWIDRCASAGVNPSAIHLDSAIWPVRAGVVQIVDLGSHALVAGGELGAFAIESDLVAALVPSWLAQAPGKVSRIETSGIDAAALVARLSSPAPDVVEVAVEDPLAAICRAAMSPPLYAPDLRQGEFSAVRRKGVSVGAWGLAAGLAVLAIALQLGVMMADGYRDAQAATTLSTQNEATFLQLRPDTKRVTNLRAQVTAALNAAQRPDVNPVMATSAQVTNVLRSHPDVRLDEVRGDRPGRLVTLRFSSAQPSALEAAMTELSAGMPNAKQGQMQTSEGRVSLTISVEAS